jgi:hypothetical protein
MKIMSRIVVFFISTKPTENSSSSFVMCIANESGCSVTRSNCQRERGTGSCDLIA